MFRVAIALVAALLAVPVAAAEKTAAKKPAAHKTVSPTTIQFWHAMSGARGAEIDALVARFNASQKAVRVRSSASCSPRYTTRRRRTWRRSSRSAPPT